MAAVQKIRNVLNLVFNLNLQFTWKCLRHYYCYITYILGIRTFNEIQYSPHY